jgi:hypothetical protein
MTTPLAVRGRMGPMPAVDPKFPAVTETHGALMQQVSEGNALSGSPDATNKFPVPLQPPALAPHPFRVHTK